MSLQQENSIVASLVSRLLAARSQGAMLASLRSESRPAQGKALKAEVKEQARSLGSHLRAGESQAALATALAIGFADFDQALSCMRRESVLRSSSYGYEGALIGRVAKALLSLGREVGASPERIAYLESIIALSKLAGNVRVLHQEIIRTVRAHREVVLKTLFVVVNSLLYRGWSNDHERGSLEAERYTSEEYAEAASLIMSIYATEFPIDDTTFYRTDGKALTEHAGIYERLLLAAIRLIKFKEAETFVDGLPYRAELLGETVTVSAIDPDIERSIRLGYIQAQGQGLLRVQHLRTAAPAVAMREFVAQGFEKGSMQELTDLAEEPFRRLRLRIPAFPQIFALFSGDQLFRDEVEAMGQLDVDNFGDWNDLTYNITDKVSTLDLFKVQRFFNFISCLYQQRLDQFEDERERGELILASTIVVVTHEGLLERMKLIFGDEDKCRQIIGLLTMNPNEGHLDLQYRPFVNIGLHYAIAPHVVAVSNIVRNTVLANRLRKAEIGDHDRMIAKVADALRKAGFLVETDYEVKLGGRQLELDVVAYRNGALFLFEGKNAYHPCSPHEMRNSWDHLKKARDQLDVRRSLLADPAHQRTLFAKLGWKAAPGTVHTGIIISNRVFHGAALNGHPVRQAHELINVLTKGHIVGPEESFRFWKAETFETADLVAYLGQDSMVAYQLASLEAREWHYSMGYRSLVFRSYVMDPLKLEQGMRERYGPAIPGGYGLFAPADPSVAMEQKPAATV